VVAANIAVLLSGLATVATMQDAITGYHLTATARGVEILLSSVGVLVGVSIAVRLGVLAGVNLTVSPDTPVALPSVPARVLAGALAAAAAAIAGYAPPRAALAAGAAGAAGSLLYLATPTPASAVTDCPPWPGSAQIPLPAGVDEPQPKASLERATTGNSSTSTRAHQGTHQPCSRSPTACSPHTPRRWHTSGPAPSPPRCRGNRYSTSEPPSSGTNSKATATYGPFDIVLRLLGWLYLATR
jgi:hypothetical protein